MNEEHALTLLQKAEVDLLSVEESRWLERWLGAQQDHWLHQRLRAPSFRQVAPQRLRKRVCEALRRQQAGSI